MRNDVFSRSPFGGKAYAHGLHFDPALDRSPLEPPLPPDSPILARWSAVRNCLPPLAELLDVEIVLMSAGYCAGGTGTHPGGGCKMPEDTALTYSLRSGQSTMVLSPGDDAVCRACPGRGDCTDMANFTGPVPEGGNVAVVEQIVAFTDDRRMGQLGLLPGKRGNPDGRTYTRVEGNARAA